MRTPEHEGSCRAGRTVAGWLCAAPGTHAPQSTCMPGPEGQGGKEASHEDAREATWTPGGALPAPRGNPGPACPQPLHEADVMHCAVPDESMDSIPVQAEAPITALTKSCTSSLHRVGSSLPTDLLRRWTAMMSHFSTLQRPCLAEHSCNIGTVTVAASSLPAVMPGGVAQPRPQ